MTTMYQILKKTNLNKRLNYKFDRRTTTVSDVNDTFAVDLVDMNSDELSNSGYILNVMDIMSRYAQSEKIPTKSKKDVQEAMEKIFQRFGNKPRKIWSDKEAAIVALKSWFSSQGIELYHVENSYMGPNTHSVGMIEAFNKKMKDFMFEHKTHHGGSWQQNISYTVNNFIPEYNNTVHGVIGTTPLEAYNGDFDVSRVQEEQNMKKKDEPTDKLKVGDLVYLQRSKEIIRGKSKTKYIDNIEEISAVIKTNPTTYRLVGHGETGYYRQQFIRANAQKIEPVEQVEQEADDTDIEEDEPIQVPEVKPPPRRSARLAEKNGGMVESLKAAEVKAPPRRSARLAEKNGGMVESLKATEVKAPPRRSARLAEKQSKS